MATRRLTDGNDTYTTVEGDEFVYALKGSDKITIQGVFYDQENEETRITVYGGPGNDHIVSGRVISGQNAYGGTGDDRIEMMGGVTESGDAFGGGGNDVLICKGGDEGCGLNGGAGQDQLINGGFSVAYMVGGPGRDRSTGDAGNNDFYIFDDGDTVAGSQRDVVSGFVRGEDKISLYEIDANTNISGNQAFTFVASTSHPAIGKVSYYKSGENTIVVANTGATTLEIQLVNFAEPLAATDFNL